MSGIGIASRLGLLFDPTMLIEKAKAVHLEWPISAHGRMAEEHHRAVA